MRKFITTGVLLLCISGIIHSQTISGVVKDEDNNPIEFANIGIVFKDVGTVSDYNGKYSINITGQSATDTLKVSCIGYESFSISVAEFRKLETKTIFLAKKVYELKQVEVKARLLKQKTLGVTSSSKTMVGVLEPRLGYELGLMMHNKKLAFLKTLHLNIADCEYDTVFFRVNIYQKNKEKDFVNILQKPIYLNVSKEEAKNVISLDLQAYDLYIKGNFLVSFEYVKDLGKGDLTYSGSILHRTYIRTTSQGEWKKVPFGVSISVDVLTE